MNFITKHIRTISIILFLAVLSVFFIFSIPKEETKSVFVFDTVAQIKLSGKNAKKTVKEMEIVLLNLENEYSKHKPDSITYKFNHLAEGEYVTLSADMQSLISLSAQISEKTDGAFDITTSPLSDLWDVKNATAPPSKEDIEKALNKVGYKKLDLKGSILTKTLAELDFGGILKGHASDKIRQTAEENGVKEGIINLGGNVCIIGEKPKTIGIVNPFSPDDVYATIEVSDTNVITSGAYQRYFEYDGKIYHHILSTQTGNPAQTDLASATVISRKGAVADALSTAIFVAGSEKGLELAKAFNVEVLLIKKDGSIIATDNIKYKKTA